jgi:hypothetical protein
MDRNINRSKLYTKVITRTVNIFKGFKTYVSNLNRKNFFLAFGNLNYLRKIRLKIFSDERYIAYLKKKGRRTEIPWQIIGIVVVIVRTY